MKNVEVGVVLYKNDNGTYDKRIPICRKVDEVQAQKIHDDELDKWVTALMDWFAKFVKGGATDDNLGSVRDT